MHFAYERPVRACVDLYWLPLGSGGPPIVRWSGRLFEWLTAGHERRETRDLYHSALQVGLQGDWYVIEMGPVWSMKNSGRGVVCEGAVGMPWLGCLRLFRYEVRCWRNGILPDIAAAVESPQRLSADVEHAQRVLEQVHDVPALTWGRDELGAGDMWNSNSLISWLLARSGHDISITVPPRGGRAPGWEAGRIAARAIS